jgi:hypothetical protein
MIKSAREVTAETTPTAFAGSLTSGNEVWISPQVVEFRDTTRWVQASSRSTAATWWLPIIVAVGAVIARATVGSALRRSLFIDEATYLFWGDRVLSGQSRSDGFLLWATGSEGYPLFVALVHHIGGVTAARWSSLVLLGAASVFAGAATRVWFGHRAQLGAVFGVWASAPFFVLADQINHTVGPVFFLSVALWGLAHFERTGRPWRLAITIVATALAGVSAHSAIPVLIPICAIATVLVGRQRRSAAWLAITTVVLWLAFVGAVRFDPVSVYRFYAAQPALRGDRITIARDALWLLAIPLVLALVGFIRNERRTLALVLFGALMFMPAIQVAGSMQQSLERQCTYGIVLAAPLIGRGVEQLATARRGQLAIIAVVTAAASALLMFQSTSLVSTWSDLRSTNRYLIDHVTYGDKVLSVHQWSLIQSLYEANLIDSPAKVVGADLNVTGAAPPDPCTLDWFVDDTTEPRSEPMRQAVQQCGTFTVVHSAKVVKTLRSNYGLFEELNGRIDVWHNEAPR